MDCKENANYVEKSTKRHMIHIKKDIGIARKNLFMTIIVLMEKYVALHVDFLT